MRTLGRILIILFVLALVTGITYTIVNASSPGGPANGPSFVREGEREEGERPPLPGAGRPEGDRDEGRGRNFVLGMILGAIRNSAIIGVIVFLVLKYKDRIRKSKQEPRVTAQG